MDEGLEIAYFSFKIFIMGHDCTKPSLLVWDDWTFFISSTSSLYTFNILCHYNSNTLSQVACIYAVLSVFSFTFVLPSQVFQGVFYFVTNWATLEIVKSLVEVPYGDCALNLKAPQWLQAFCYFVTWLD